MASANVATVTRFYDIADGRSDGNLTELFTEDVEIFAPKFGRATGIEAMLGAGKGTAAFRRMAHHVDEFEIVELGDRVIVEGTTEGETATGRTWDGRKTVGGRFCAVFDLHDARIRRMYVYFDPDHGDAPESVDGTIRRTPEMNEVHFERRFDAPVERLWSFVSEPELLTKWMGGPVDTLEPEPGGKVVIQIAPKMGATVYGKVLEFDPERLLLFTWEVPAWGHSPDLLGTTMRWEVEADGGGSRIKLTHALPHAAGREHLLSAAWHLHLDQLGELLAGNDAHYVIEQPRIHALVLRYLDVDSAARREYYEELLGMGG